MQVAVYELLLLLKVPIKWLGHFMLQLKGNAGETGNPKLLLSSADAWRVPKSIKKTGYWLQKRKLNKCMEENRD